MRVPFVLVRDEIERASRVFGLHFSRLSVYGPDGSGGGSRRSRRAAAVVEFLQPNRACRASERERGQKESFSVQRVWENDDEIQCRVSDVEKVREHMQTARLPWYYYFTCAPFLTQTSKRENARIFRNILVLLGKMLVQLRWFLKISTVITNY